MKCAVFVEGQSEMFFVAHFLQTYFDYDSDKLYFECHEIRRTQMKSLNFPKLGDNRDVPNYYMIVNVGGDTSVSSVLNSRFQGLLKQGYELLIGLRDVYGDQYKDINKHQRSVNPEVIDRMYEWQSNALKTPGVESRLHFAVMEFEAWMLGLMEVFLMGRGIELQQIVDSVKHDFVEAPEQIYHPAVVVKDIYGKIGENYDKHSGDTQDFLKYVGKNDYKELFESGKCASFNKFVESLIGPDYPGGDE